jgi:hypothetical protein
MDWNDPQLGFDALLNDADRQNRMRRFERINPHLPGTMEEAVEYFRRLLKDHDAAMMDADSSRAFELRSEAKRLAWKLNGQNPIYCPSDDDPEPTLARLTQALPGQTPLWGQQAEYTISAAGMRVRIEQDGIFDLGVSISYWPGFSAYVVDEQKPFLSETGFRNFQGFGYEPMRNVTPPEFARIAIEDYVEAKLYGKLVAIDAWFLQEDAS